MEYEQLSLDWCASCGRDEPVSPYGAYLICPECGHVYEDNWDLEKAYIRILDEMLSSPLWDGWPEANYSLKAHEIPFCPMCLHDF